MISNYSQLFFYNITDRRISTSPFFDSGMYHHVHWQILEEMGNAFTEAYNQRLTINSRKIEIFNSALSTEECTPFFRLLIRIGFLFITIFGMGCKAIFWYRNWEYIKKRNNFIIKKLAQQSKAEQPIVLFPNKNFTEISKINKQRNSLERVPANIVSYNLAPFLTIKDLQSFAQISRENYQIAGKSLPVKQFLLKYHKYPQAALKCIGTKNIDRLKRYQENLSVTSTDQSINMYLDVVYSALSDIENISFRGHLISADLDFNPHKKNQEVDLEKIRSSALELQKMLKTPFRKFSENEFTIKFKDNISQGEQALVFSEKGMIHLYWFLPYHLWLFLNEWDRSPKVLDYFDRLRNGQPCGRFPKELNEHIPYDDTREDLATLLQEGPTLCEDGVTPVIQLSSSEN